MARYWRKWHKRRRHWRPRYRSWKRFPRWRHRRWGRRGRHFRYRTAPVRYTPSRRHKTLIIKGYEPLGNVCATTTAKKEAKPYIDLDQPNPKKNYDDTWSGSWGHHFFSLEKLLIRSQYYFADFSTNWQTYDYIQFKGGYIWLPRFMYFDWMFYLDHDLQDKDPQMMDKYTKTKSWFHPGIFMNRRGAFLIGSPHRFGLTKFFRKIKVKPPSSWEGLYLLPDAFKYIFLHWAWTWVDLEQSFMDSFCVKTYKEGTSACHEVPWFMGGVSAYQPTLKTKEYKDPRAAWVDRTVYDHKACNATTKDYLGWGPFCPWQYGFQKGQDRSVFFKYKFFFKLSGESVYRPLPAAAGADLVPEAPQAEVKHGRKIPPRSILKRRPPSTSDILPGDLDSDGILTDEALARITEDCPGGQSALLVPKRVRFRLGRRHRLRRIHHLLRKLGME
nr:ORF1 [Torque teno Leptonychotes weddellii virus 2]